MTHSTDIRILSAAFSHEPITFRTPIKFGGRVMSEMILLNVDIEVETRDGRRGKGFGSMPMANVWAWPSNVVSGEKALGAMLNLGERLTAAASDYSEIGHPLEITHALASDQLGHTDAACQEVATEEPMPPLARLVAASPVEAAIYDAFGKAIGLNVYNAMGKEFVNSDLASYLTDEFKGEYLDQYTLREPKPTIPLYHLVGALDPLSAGDIVKPVGDGLPETLSEWIPADGLTHLKIKLNGDDLDWDVERVANIERVAVEAQSKRGCSGWNYSLDFNEKCENVEYVLGFLAKLKEAAPEAMERVQYIEQPTHRDLRDHPENRMHEAAKIKPVVIDESLIDLESLQLAQEQGYTGVALKACKGHSEALLMGAAAQKHGLFLCVQDLTCPGASFLHSASLAARIPTVAAIEGNGRQYCPSGSHGWEDRYPGMFNITDGTVETGLLNGPGLGF